MSLIADNHRKTIFSREIFNIVVRERRSTVDAEITFPLSKMESRASEKILKTFCSHGLVEKIC